MKKLLVLFLLLPTMANALCLQFYFDKDGQSHSVKCGSDLPELQCEGNTYWNGQACVPIKIAQICESQGGQWEEVQLRGAHFTAALEQDALLHSRSIIHMCACPNEKVWDGKKCRTDVPLSQQCKAFPSYSNIRMTKEFFGPGDCPQVPQ